jgi:putative membrane protein
MLFIYGGVWWLLTAGLVMSAGIIIDVYSNERESLGKVIVYPFFILAIGLILFAASVYILSVFSGITELPLAGDMGAKDIFYSTSLGILSAITGVVIQFFVNKKMAELSKQEIIEVI